jgi:hypothetical protein
MEHDPNIKHIRLINGEEIIGNVISNTKTKIVVSEPLLVDQNDEYVILTSYLPFSNPNQCDILKSHIITQSYLHPEMIRYYYYSLKFVNKKDMVMLQEIHKVNSMMQASLLSELVDSGRLVKGSTVIN